jgi:GNAT superfamily N-acetyltransferase
MHLMLPGAREFFATGQLQGSLNEEHYVETLSNYTKMGVGFVLARVEDGVLHGALGAAIHPDYATGDLTAVEFFLFVLEKYRGFLGIKLMNAYEQEAKRRGAKRTYLMHMLTEGSCNLAPLYERKGYKLVEHVYVKELYFPMDGPQVPIRT